MPELKFETGLTEYTLNGKCKVYFNPADREFAEKFADAFETLERIQNEYGEKGKLLEPGKEVFELARERDAKMQKIIDELFAAPVCESVFGSISVCALADGLPVWLNLMLAVTDEIEKNLGEVPVKADPRVKKYTDKYSKYTSKYHK